MENRLLLYFVCICKHKPVFFQNIRALKIDRMVWCICSIGPLVSGHYPDLFDTTQLRLLLKQVIHKFTFLMMQNSFRHSKPEHEVISISINSSFSTLLDVGQTWVKPGKDFWLQANKLSLPYRYLNKESPRQSTPLVNLMSLFALELVYILLVFSGLHIDKL